jgi:hypothetical protein
MKKKPVIYTNPHTLSHPFEFRMKMLPKQKDTKEGWIKWFTSESAFDYAVKERMLKKVNDNTD